MRASRRIGVTAIGGCLALLSGLLVAAPASPEAATAVRNEPGPTVRLQELDQVEPVPEFEDGTVDVETGPSLANRPVTERLIGPGRLEPTIPAGDTLVGQVSGAATDRLEQHGLTTDGAPDPDVTKLLPDTTDVPILDLPGGTFDLIEDIAGQIDEWSGIDLLELYHALPEGLPLLTYRLCAESDTRSVSCSLPRPLVVPAVADVTGDGTPDILADLLPAVNIGSVLSLSGLIADLRDDLATAEADLAEVLAILADPLQVLLHPWATLRKLQLDQLIADLTETIDDHLLDLIDTIQLGLGFLSVRLPTSETHGGDLEAQVWAEYDLPTGLDVTDVKRLSVGYDGYRRGSGLSDLDWSTYTVDLAAAVDGTVDAEANAFRLGPSASIGTVLGVMDVEDGERHDPTLINALQTQVPESFSAHAVVDTGSYEGRLELTSSRETTLDALVLTNKRRSGPYDDRFTQIVIDQLPASATAEITRNTPDGEGRFAFTASSPIEQAEAHDHVYRGPQLQKLISGTATRLPTELSASWQDVDGETQQLAYRANAALAESVDATYFDRQAERTVFRGHLGELPASLDLTHDIAAHRLRMDTPTRIGVIEAIVQRNGEAIATPDGDHATLISNPDGRVGFSGRISGLSGFDITYGEHPHAVVTMQPGGQPFLGWADVDGTHLARIDVSNLPSRVEVDVDPSARTAAYRAAEQIESLRAAYTNTQAGPTVDGTLHQVPESVDTSFRLGDTPQFNLTASSGFARAEAFYSPGHVTRVDPAQGEDLAVTVTGVPSEATVDVDLVNQHLEWNASAPVDSVDAVARTPYDGRPWVAAARVQGVPQQFDADFSDGFYRFRGLSGPVGSAHVAVSNHPDPTAPQEGSHLAAHYLELTGDLDASVKVSGVSAAEFSAIDDGFRVDLDLADQPIALDANVIEAATADGRSQHDTRYGVLGRLSNAPGTLEVTAPQNAPLTYTSDRSIGVEAKLWIGKADGIGAAGGAPKFDEGISLVQGGCDEDQPGCAHDGGSFCLDDGCFGLVAFINMTGLPTEVTVDAAKKVYGLNGYESGGKNLRLYVAGDEIFAGGTLDGFKVLADLIDLPEKLDLTVGPIETDDTFSLDYTSNLDSDATLKVHAEGDGVPDLGTVTAKAELSPIPRQLHVEQLLGTKPGIAVDNSTGLDKLDVRATGTFGGEQASAEAVLTQIPAKMDLTSGGSAQEDRTSVLTLGYEAWDADGGQTEGADTLDGDLRVEAPMVFLDEETVKIASDVLRLHFEDLGHDTTITVDDEHAIMLTSRPVTGELELGGDLKLQVPRGEYDIEFDCSTLGASYMWGRFSGHTQINPSTIGDVSVKVRDLRRMRMQPGRKVHDYLLGGALPDALAPLFYGIDDGPFTPEPGRGYEDVTVTLTDVSIDSDINLLLVLNVVGVNVPLIVPFRIVGEFDNTQVHQYNNDQALDDWDWPLSEIDALKVKPGPYAKDKNGISITRIDPQMITLIDIGDQLQDRIMHLLSPGFWPFDGQHEPPPEQEPGDCEVTDHTED